MSVNKATMARLATGGLLVGSSPSRGNVDINSAVSVAVADVTTFVGAGVLTVLAVPANTPSAGTLQGLSTTGVPVTITYTGTTGTTFTGCTTTAGTGGLAVGSQVGVVFASPSLITRILNSAVVINPGANIPASSGVDISVNLPGVRVGDQVHVTPPGAIEAGLTWSAFVSANDVVKIRISNVTVGAVTTATRTWQLLWIKLVNP